MASILASIVALIAIPTGIAYAPICTNFINGTSGPDTIDGTPGPDCIQTGDGEDVVNGEGGDDRISTGNGEDTVNAGAGADKITTGNDNDTIYLGADGVVDRVECGLGTDTVFSAEVGIDKLYGCEITLP